MELKSNLYNFHATRAEDIAAYGGKLHKLISNLTNERPSRAVRAGTVTRPYSMAYLLPPAPCSEAIYRLTTTLRPL